MFRYATAAAISCAALAAPAFAQDDPPNLVQGIHTNAFGKAFPTEIEDLQSQTLETNPAEGSVYAVYGNEDDTRNIKIRVLPLPPDGIAGTLERSMEYYGGRSEIDPVSASHESPQGHPMDCFATRKGELGYNICLAEVSGRGVRLQMGAVVDAEADSLPADITERDLNLAGLFVDALAEIDGEQTEEPPR